jgi:hypothetical protein
MNKAWWINSETKQITEVEIHTHQDMNKYVGGWLECAVRLPHGNVCYVDEEGMLKKQDHFFMIMGNSQPLAGNGLVVGREVETDDSYYTEDVSVPYDIMLKLVTFLDKEYVRSWGKANASEPSMIITGVDSSGKITRNVINRYGDVIKRVVGDEEETK